MDMYGFYTGKIFDAYEYLGGHVTEKGSIFRVFAPAALKVSIIGDFNNWTETKMNKIYDGNFWECEISGAGEGMRYKYRIYRQDGEFIDHCDPYGFGMELRPQTGSIVRNLSAYQFHDDKWLSSRTDCMDKPLNIYELHMGSWKTNKEDKNGWYRYNMLADKLIPYVKEQGYNYIELLPVSEHPCDNSWGYQNTGFYSPTSRYGKMDELKEFIDKCHQNNIGVLLDFVPVHFAVDDYALANFDGTPLYEYPHIDVGNSEWGSKNFNHSRGEVQSFLQSNANYWIREYHFDGLRIDAISNIIYWQGNPDRGENLNAIEFIRNMNKGLKERYPTIILAAEDSTAYPMVTGSTEKGGLGFDYKWDMGWMNDTLSFMQQSPKNRVKEYHKLTFSMMYYYSEKFIMPLSHDEVVHGKATILQKMNGEYEEKFPQARTIYMYMYAHPGKKLNFMGNEFAQLREWDEKREQDWDILVYPVHDAFHRFMRELNQYIAILNSIELKMKGVCWNRPISVFLYLRAIHCRSPPVLTSFQMQSILEMEDRIMTDKEDKTVRQFVLFCRTALMYEKKNYYNERKHMAERETHIEMLSLKQSGILEKIFDAYHADYFPIMGYEIGIVDGDLAQAFFLPFAVLSYACSTKTTNPSFSPLGSFVSYTLLAGTSNGTPISIV